jgi:hypothetical protein
MVVRLKTDSKTNLRGFDAAWREATAAETDAAKKSVHSCSDGKKNGFETGVDCGGAECFPCGGTCSGSTIIHWNATRLGNSAIPLSVSGAFTDGSDAGGVYDPDRRCRFVMTAPPEKLIALRFSWLDTEAGSDVIRVYDGDAETAADERTFFGYETVTTGPAGFVAPTDSTTSTNRVFSVLDAVTDAGRKKLGEFSGEYNRGRLNKIGLNNVGEVISSGPAMIVTFASDSSSQRRGFEATWELRDNPNMLVVKSVFDGLEAVVALSVCAFLGILALGVFIWRRTHKTHHHVRTLLHHHSMLHKKFDEEFDSDDDDMSLNAYPTDNNPAQNGEDEKELPFLKPRSMRRAAAAAAKEEPISLEFGGEDDDGGAMSGNAEPAPEGVLPDVPVTKVPKVYRLGPRGGS